MRVKRVITIDKVIYQCKFSCPYYGNVGNEMVCEHPLAPDDGCIITHPECMEGFPKECPEARGAKVGDGSA